MKKEIKLLFWSMSRGSFFCLFFFLFVSISSDLLVKHSVYWVLANIYISMLFSGLLTYKMDKWLMKCDDKDIELIDQKKSHFFEKENTHSTEFIFTTQSIKDLEVSK